MNKNRLFYKMRQRWQLDRKWNKIEQLEKQVDKLMKEGKEIEANFLAKKATAITNKAQHILEQIK